MASFVPVLYTGKNKFKLLLLFTLNYTQLISPFVEKHMTLQLHHGDASLGCITIYATLLLQYAIYINEPNVA